MGIRVACSYRGIFKTPIAPSQYSAILVTIQQDGVNLISKTQDQLEIEEDSVVMNLTQEETHNFEPGKMAFVQIRAYKSAYEAPGSKCWPVPVWPSLDTRILP